jgi:UPF0271 protein
MTAIDLNADVGEGAAAEAELLQFVSSASVACGGHAGDARSMRETVARAVESGVAIGAHPGYPDKRNFGRVEIGATPTEIENWVVNQIRELQSVCMSAGARVLYVKPHGALYNRALRDRDASAAIIAAIRSIDASLMVLAAPGSAILAAAAATGIRSAREAFLDRGYKSDGRLVPRNERGALLEDPDAAAARAVALARHQPIEAADGTTLVIDADSLCVHGDGLHAASIARNARKQLEAAGVSIAPFA